MLQVMHSFNFIVGLQFPKIVCMAAGEKESSVLCSYDKMPDLLAVKPKHCNLKKCKEKYEWKSLEGTCSVSCGNGQSRLQ